MPKQISENKRNMILNGNLSQTILMLAVPVMINSFIQSMYNLTDTFWLGRIGTENQSAITLVSPFQNILNSFGTVTVEIERFISNERGGYDINGLILVEREGQKKMVIGNKGAKIKTIGIEARKDMQEMFEAPVHLELWVKVKSGWADDERALRSLGYGDDQ